jgi:hypothetical protein
MTSMEKRVEMEGEEEQNRGGRRRKGVVGRGRRISPSNLCILTSSLVVVQVQWSPARVYVPV